MALYSTARSYHGSTRASATTRRSFSTGETASTLAATPLEQFRYQWPEKPASLRASLEAYTTAVRAVALRLLRLTAAGLGLDEAHFEEGGLIAGPVISSAKSPTSTRRARTRA
ncbi:unnamed protein product [Urochloa humidicola]